MKVHLGLKSAFAALLIFTSAAVAMAADVAVIGGKNDDPFWNKIKKGVDDARVVVEANGGKVEYLRMQSYDNFAADAAEIIRVAISQKPQGIAVPDWVFESQDGPIKEAITAGIKVILMNAGTADKAREIGAINYVGTDEYLRPRCRRLSGQARREVWAVRQRPSRHREHRSALQGPHRCNDRRWAEGRAVAIGDHGFR